MGNIHHQGLKLTLATHGSGVYGRSASLPFSALCVLVCKLLYSATSGLMTKLDEVEVADHHFSLLHEVVGVVVERGEEKGEPCSLNSPSRKKLLSPTC